MLIAAQIWLARWIQAALFILPLLLLGQGSFANSDVGSIFDQRLAERAKLDKLGTPFDCLEYNLSFEFLILAKESEGKAFEKKSVCRLVNEYDSHVYNNLTPFWPLNINLGMTVEIQTDRRLYNASFHANLLNSHIKPFLTLIYIAQVPVEPQRFVWSHEYGHAVFDEFVREVLNERFNFDELVRSFKREQVVGGSEINAEVEAIQARIDSLNQVLNSHRQRLTILDEAYKRARERYNLASTELSKVSNSVSDRNRQLSEIHNAFIDVTNALTQLANETGVRDYSSYPTEIQERMKQHDQIVDGDTDCEPPRVRHAIGCITPIYIANAERKVELLRQAKEALATYLAEKAKTQNFAPDLDQQLLAKLSVFEEAQRIEIAAREAIEALSRVLLRTLGEESKLDVELGALQGRFFASKGITMLPGLSMLSNFHEFFADLFAAVYHNNPNVIGDAFFAIHNNEQAQKRAEMRRFSPLQPEAFPIEVWTNQFAGAHAYFTPVRAQFDGSLITELHDRGLSKKFLQEVLKEIAGLMARYSFSKEEALFEILDPIVEEARAVRTEEQAVEFITKAIDQERIESSFIQLSDVRDWCSFDYTECMGFMLTELEKGSAGLFLAAPNPLEANRLLLEAVNKAYQTTVE